MLYNIPCRSIPMPYYKYVIPQPDYYTLPLTFENVSNDSATIWLNKSSSSAPTMNLNYSTDGTNWSSLGYNSVQVPTGGKVMISGINSSISQDSDSNHNIFKASGNGKLKVYGNINSIVCDSQGNFGTGKYVYYDLFNGNTNIVDAYNLKFPSQKVNQRGLISLFKGCTALTAAPKKIEGQIDGQWTMCNMFSGCTNLVYASEIGTTYANTNMFQDFCYNCNNLLKAPFFNFTSNGGGSASENFLRYAFYNCYALSAIEIKMSTWPGSTSNWVNGVASFGLFILPYNYSGSTSRGNSNIPNNWLILKRQSDFSLKYGQSYDGHSEGDVYNGQYGDDPYAEYYQ